MAEVAKGNLPRRRFEGECSDCGKTVAVTVRVAHSKRHVYIKCAACGHVNWTPESDANDYLTGVEGMAR